VTSYASNLASTIRRMMLIIQTLVDSISKDVVSGSAWSIRVKTHNPPQEKIPVKVSFCFWVVRRRQSKGRGCKNIVSDR
jgi:hypothetical protein